ncbi:chlorophyll synthesis pathway protein BchC [Polytolypa hystricis UAMH7299]|uniref:D-xylulose reductase n=1 Tax=Polytolypa hystricis (strain UAMH7299) TaxID=1447883 RepID=A0A2B7XHP9_POLH7|nr:chlorophyll synthesis pathway protein BchC [Polytolypa hystricis UAMH7299]
MPSNISLPNQALLMDGVDKLDIRAYPLTLPTTADGNAAVPTGCVLVRVKATGICGSDIHLWKHGSAVGTVVTEPYAMGHECAGQVVAVAEDIADWKVGDRIAIKPGVACFACEDCTRGYGNLCANMRYSGTPGVDGGCQTYRVVPVTQLVRLTPKISWTEAGLIQPLAVSIQMARQAGLRNSQKVMILGGGCIGLLLGAMAKSFGASQVVVFEKQTHRVEFAKSYCADHAFQNPPRNNPDETTQAYATRVSKHILESVPGVGRGFDICIEATGAEECMQMGIKLCRPGGTYIQVGMYRGKLPEINMMEVCVKQLNVRGTIRYGTNCFEEAVELIDRGLVDVKRLVSHTFDFNDSLSAFEAVYNLHDVQGKEVFKTVILHGDGDQGLESVVHGESS